MNEALCDGRGLQRNRRQMWRVDCGLQVEGMDFWVARDMVFEQGPGVADKGFEE